VASKDFVPGDIILCLPPIAAGTVHCQSTVVASIHHKINNSEERKAQNNITLQIWQIFRSKVPNQILFIMFARSQQKRSLLDLIESQKKVETIGFRYQKDCAIIFLLFEL
jgi:hypothetical protein